MNLPRTNLSIVHGKNVYISGPMTGMPDHNRVALNRIETACVDEGAVYVWNPAYLIPSLDEGESDRHDLMRSALEVLLELARCENAVVLQLPGWRLSSGCLTEWMVATQLGVECVEVMPGG